MASDRLSEYIYNLFPVKNEEDQWLRDELLDLEYEVMMYSGYHLRGQIGMGARAFRKRRNDRLRICHNLLIEKGIESPFDDLFNETKYNPDKKKKGKKKKGGRRRI